MVFAENYQGNTIQDFRAKENSFKNCSFKQGNILNLEKLYKPNSIDVLLYRNALYHTLTTNKDIFGFERTVTKDAQEKMNSIAKQMNKVVKNYGLVVFGENESSTGVDSCIISKSMKNNGFVKYISSSTNITDNIWIKVKNINK